MVHKRWTPDAWKSTYSKKAWFTFHEACRVFMDIDPDSVMEDEFDWNGEPSYERGQAENFIRAGAYNGEIGIREAGAEYTPEAGLTINPTRINEAQWLIEHASFRDTAEAEGCIWVLDSDIDFSCEENSEEYPKWMKIYAAKSALRTYEVAWIMEGKEPPDRCPKTYLIGSNEKRYLDAINEAVLLGDITTKNTQWHVDDDSETWRLDHQAVIEWCQRTGCEWPLLQFMQPAQTEIESTADTERPTQTVGYQNQDDFKQELDDLRKEVAELRSTVEELKKSVPLYPVRLMAKAIEVQHKHWQDPENARPNAESIIAELTSQNPELSAAKARMIEAVACPIERQK